MMSGMPEPNTQQIIAAVTVMIALIAITLPQIEHWRAHRQPLFWLHLPPGHTQPCVMLATPAEARRVQAVRPVLGPYYTYRAADLASLDPTVYVALLPKERNP